MQRMLSYLRPVPILVPVLSGTPYRRADPAPADATGRASRS